ncbi:MAG TPA: hypothetical protein VJ246_02135 [Patescibacteria group bacterium]|nr:hypothetical protein [Patescibacteria group bacterium]
MAKKTARKTTPRVSSKKNTAMAAIAYVLFFIPLLTDAKKDSFVMFHVKQSIVLLIAGVGWSIAAKFLYYIPVLGVIAGLAGLVIDIFLLIVWVKGIMNALGGKTEELPVIGMYAKQLKF